MHVATPVPVRIRDASVDDLAALVALKATPELHRDRLADAEAGYLRYLVIEEGAVLGFGMLILRWPPRWANGGEINLPKVVDLYLAPEQRSRGLGTMLLGEMERLAMAAGFDQLKLSVDPVDNRRAYQLYRRLGYVPQQSTPYRCRWSFADSGGRIYAGEGWNLDLAKPLRNVG